MRLALLSSGSGWHVQDLQRAATSRKMTVQLADFAMLNAWVASGPLPPCGGGLGWGVEAPTDHKANLPPQPSFPRGEGARPEACLVRTMPAGSLEQIIFRMDVLHAAESIDILVFNRPRALECCIDKYLTTQRLAAAGLPVPRTWCGQTTDDALIAFADLGRDVVIKPLFGSEGRGMVRVSDPDAAWRICHAIEATGGVLYLQEFVPHDGFDVRVFVIGDQMLAAMKRHGREWRTNVAQGGRPERHQPSSREVELAVAAARATGSVIAGVDLLLGPNGWVVLEVNGVPGWRALSTVCEIDVAGAILDFIVQRVET